MPHPDQKYIDAIINNHPALIEEIYQKYSGLAKEMVKKPEWAADVFRRVLLFIRNQASQSSFTLTSSFEELFLKECKKKIDDRVIFVEPRGYINKGAKKDQHPRENRLQEERIRLINEALEKLDTKCQKILLLSWSPGSLDETFKKNNLSEEFNRNKKDVRKLKSYCMQKLIKLLDPVFHTKTKNHE